MRDPYLPSHVALQSSNHVISRDEIKTLYLRFHEISKHQIWHRGDFDSGASAHITSQITLDHMAT